MADYFISFMKGLKRPIGLILNSCGWISKLSIMWFHLTSHFTLFCIVILRSVLPRKKKKPIPTCLSLWIVFSHHRKPFLLSIAYPKYTHHTKSRQGPVFPLKPFLIILTLSDNILTFIDILYITHLIN